MAAARGLLLDPRCSAAASTSAARQRSADRRQCQHRRGAAAFFPRISPRSSAAGDGFSSGLFASGSWPSLAPRWSLPIFDAGRSQVGWRLRAGRVPIAVAQYESPYR